MKKLLNALTISAYLVPASLLVTLLLVVLVSAITPDPSELLVLLAVSPLILALPLSWSLSIASMARARRAAKTAQPLPFPDILRCKLRLLPFYLLDFVGLTVFGFMTMSRWGFFMIPVACGHIWWVMAGVSAHGIAKLSVLRGQKWLTTKQYVLHCLLQLIFACDLIDSIYLTKLEKQIQAQGACP
ncbi:MAG: hypothetical protein FWF60_00940 [Oscillospiraceae bacterium]|nr:hypothetical protein [Oscillospiraceae bacterium]